ncbi:MAG: hypothetical protein M1819_002016 [Sarea resinae]|nr:MAG: hypothetical protein M1819_002016 [Sarea resinae]
MPAQLPRASFEPIPPDLDLDALVESTPNFHYVTRITVDMIEERGRDEFEKLVMAHVLKGGKPLVIEGFQDRWDQSLFSPQWLRSRHGTKVEMATDLTLHQPMPLTIGHYLRNMGKLTNQWNRHNYKELERQRIYLKDIDCPPAWHEKLKALIPPGVFYLNESVGSEGGPGSTAARSPGGRMRTTKGIAKAGDLMSSLPDEMRAENLMCYIGHEGTYTPAHREMCASFGQNIMVETSERGVDQDGSLEKPGSSIWFMTETQDRHMVSEYWLSVLGHDIEIEAHFAQINAWKQAPFTTYVVEQKVGDFIIIPPLAPHQVWNRGTRTMKVAWNRTTVETLEMALNEALPRARLVCRDEQYKNKAIIYWTLKKYSSLLESIQQQFLNAPDDETANRLARNPKIRQLGKDFKRLYDFYTSILLSEMFSPAEPRERNIEYLPYDSFVTCSYCRCNIFNRFLTCKTCIIPLEHDEEDTYDICMDCFVMGRSCGCISKLKWVEQFKWEQLTEHHERFRQQLIDLSGKGDPPPTLQKARALFPKKTVAEICQQQLKIRPWRDVTKPPPPKEQDDDEDDIEVNDDGAVKKRKKKRRSEKWLRDNVNCHICKTREESWKMAKCSCGISYCYGSLFRAFDLMPQEIMEDPDWKCPRCQKVCSCGVCRKNPEQRAVPPKGTRLGHDTRKVADPRSVESLVDFGHSNIRWLKTLLGDEREPDSTPLDKKRREAANAKSRVDEADDLDNEENGPHIHESIAATRRKSGRSSQQDFPIDPRLEPDYVIPAPFMPTDASLQQALRSNEPYGKPSATANAANAKTLHYASEGLRHLEQSTLNPSTPQGLSNSSAHPPDAFVAPEALMVRKDGRFVPQQNGLDPNAITYQYPDPEIGQSDSNPALAPSMPPLATKPSNTVAGQKRKRDQPSLIRSDISRQPEETTENDVDEGATSDTNLGPRHSTRKAPKPSSFGGDSQHDSIEARLRNALLHHQFSPAKRVNADSYTPSESSKRLKGVAVSTPVSTTKSHSNTKNTTNNNNGNNGSIFSRPGMSNKKSRIVSANSASSSPRQAAHSKPAQVSIPHPSSSSSLGRSASTRSRPSTKRVSYAEDPVLSDGDSDDDGDEAEEKDDDVEYRDQDAYSERVLRDHGGGGRISVLSQAPTSAGRRTSGRRVSARGRG